jgi:hypothetical protein
MVEIILSLFQSLLPERGGGGVNQKNYSRKGFAALGRTADVWPPLKTDGESDNIKKLHLYIYLYPSAEGAERGAVADACARGWNKAHWNKGGYVALCVCVFLCLFIYLRDQLSASAALIGGCELCDSSKSHVLSARSRQQCQAHMHARDLLCV